ncbi:CHAD domain-containing protein [Pontibacillus litoralis]|uniref:SpoVT-AbrB domain-containing protein n=1 Tax=Pontibacillus litoralis JSM 072002 TaxID=1385512 RepID=A0A0A5FZ48_9BACI|nr:CHAD domain-containing protein [Pontibacillus litoralis]KGX86111.1 hypothetical protein N784_05985 [Pontibacillus litoralis JSM 072002]
MDSALVTVTLDRMGRIIVPKKTRDALRLANQHLLVEYSKDNKGIILLKAEKGINQKTKTIDGDGRFLIPASFRHSLQWGSGMNLELYSWEDKLIVSEGADRCNICKSRNHLLLIKQHFLCENCLFVGTEAFVSKWNADLNKLAHQYVTYCYNAISFRDTEDVHQARVVGRRIEMMLTFIGVEEDHALLVAIKEAHKQLGSVRESDVFIDYFYKRLQQEKNQELALVYRAYMELREDKRRKQQKKLKKSLPTIITDQFLEQWNEFTKEQLPTYLLLLNVDSRLCEYEQSFAVKVKKYEQEVTENEHHSSIALNALHHVRLVSKSLRYIYDYISSLYGEPYKTKAENYKEIQSTLGVIHDRYDFLKEIKNNKKKVEVKKKQIKLVEQQIVEELQSLIIQVDLNQLKQI